ncbi:MAG: metal-dependent transcriptional regulator [Proteobacteria bacterium]|nr:metal-dependent transcriptional regulator [Pseudomonadota bacterium]
MTAPKAKQKNILTPVMEDYLEAIYDIGLEKKVVRVRDIAEKMSVRMPTVTSMLKNLSGRELVEYEKYEHVELSARGKKVAKEMHRRHRVLRSFLIDILKIDHRTADDQACKMEHALSSVTLDRFVDFMSFIHECPRAGENWLEHFDEFRKHGHQPGTCRANLDAFACELPFQAQSETGEDRGVEAE